MTNRKKALVLLDGSQRSLMTVDYLTSVAMFREMKLVLYNVFSGIPESYWDLEKEPASYHIYHDLKAWEREKKQQIEDHMALARKRLLDAGFDASAVEIKIHNRERGIARDILEEAQHGYDTVVLRRRGMGQMEGLSMGSIASKLLSRLHHLPVQVAGRKEQNKRILIAVDGSPSAVHAVDYVAGHLGGHGYTAELFHVIRGFGSSIPENPEFAMPPESLETAERKMREHFRELREKLLTAGFKAENVSEKISTGVHSRSGSIVKEAEMGNFSSIALGRQGHSKVQEFFMGRVSHKVVHHGRYHSVWII